MDWKSRLGAHSMPCRRRTTSSSRERTVTILFQGAGTRWIGELTKADDPFHVLLETVKDKVAGVSCPCASVFCAMETATQAGYELVKDNPVPGTPGLPSLQKLTREGYTVLSF
jgi:hypothetical protein